MKPFTPPTDYKVIDVRDFIQERVTPYDGSETFLAPISERTKQLWQQITELIKQERQKGILDLDVATPSTITSHRPGYINKDQELIVGLQTDAPLKRSIKPNGGIRLVEKAAAAYGYTIPQNVVDIFEKYRKSHNDGVFSAYTETMRLLRSKHVLTGLPDNYGRGRIIGDYRRVALYGTDYLIAQKEQDYEQFAVNMTDEHIRLREEMTEQIKALKELTAMAKEYGYDLSKPATTAREAIQWLYFGYLAAVKEQDGAAMSIGRIDAFLDIYIEADLREGRLTEAQAQELIDDFVIKLRIVKHLRAPEYNELFAGDPTWVTLALGGTDLSGRSLVTKTAFRFLHTLSNLGPAPEPNLTVLWGEHLPAPWKEYCAQMSIESSSIQYENDDLMKPYYGDDYGIACCVSGMAMGKDMQLFGARCNMAKTLLLAINGGKEEPLTHASAAEPVPGGDVIIPGLKPLNDQKYLDYDQVWKQFRLTMEWLAEQYVNTMNVIHYMHDKYNYEHIEMALHDSQVRRFMAFGLAGLSVVGDSLSAIKYAKVRPIWNNHGVAERYEITGDFPTFGNDDDRVDEIVREITKEFIRALRRYATYRNSVHTLSILTITSNVVYGKATGATPDGRDSGMPFAPGANPMHGRDRKGAIASLNSVAKIDYADCQDGISNTFSIAKPTLGKSDQDQVANLVQLLDGYFMGHHAHHLNVNVLSREMLLDAQKHPELYPQLTIRISGYAVNFVALSKEHQDELIARTFHEHM